MFDVPSSVRGDSTAKSPILILDGGLGTTLEDVFHQDISTPLWSANPIDKEPEVIIDTHLAFLRAGARILLTATYQCAYDTFERAGYSRGHAVHLMRKAVRLAQAAKSRYLNEHPFVQGEDIKIALALGPFGSTISTHEFDGIYPPPYGPAAYDPSSHTNTNHFDREEDEEAATEALKTFHLERLRVFAGDRETWEDIDWIAFETVPLRREIRAIRRAMGELRREGKTKPWWLSTVHPGGQFPEKTGCGDGERVQVGEVMHALLDDDGDDAQPSDAAPDGVGINCTAVGHIPALLHDMTLYIQQRPSPSPQRPKPWLVVYPNGGDWNHTAQTWVPDERRGESEGEAWAKLLRDSVRPALESRAWKGLILGGCCKTGPREIAALTKDTIQR